MNYFDYINNLKPDNNLKNKTKSRVMFEISKQNTKKSNLKKASISIAACFIVLIISISISRVLIKNSDNIHNATETEKLTTQNVYSDKILVSVASDGLAAGPQTVLLEDKLYLQYCKGDIIKKYESDDKKIEINKSDIGELVYTINEYNLVDGMNMKFLKGLDTETAKHNKFYNAKVYKLKNCKNDTVFLVKRDVKEDEYYFFCLKGVNSKNTVSEVIDIFTLGESNPIKYINVFQQDSKSKNIESYIKKTTIKDSETVNSVIDILRSCSINCNAYDIVSKGYVENEFSEDDYLLEIVFDDNTKLNVYLFKEYFNFFITQEDEYDYYLFNGSEYDSLLELFNN